MLNATLDWQLTLRFSSFLSAEHRSSAFRPHNFHEPQNGGDGQGRVANGWRDSNIVPGDLKGFGLLNLGGEYRFCKQVALKGVIYNR